MRPIFTVPERLQLKHMNLKRYTLLMFLFFAGFVSGFASGYGCDPDGEDLLKKASAIVEETSQRTYCGQETEKKISYASVYPKADENNVVITFTIDEQNKIHVLNVQGGNTLLNHYIKTSLEGKELKSENAIPGINYVMTVKIPTCV